VKSFSIVKDANRRKMVYTALRLFTSPTCVPDAALLMEPSVQRRRYIPPQVNLIT